MSERSVPRPPAAIGAFFASLALAAAISSGTAAGTRTDGASNRQAAEEVRDGVTHVLNAAEPAEPPRFVDLKELWRIGGDDDEEFLFGVLSQITLDGEGNIYLLDAQLSQVVVFSPDGEYLRTIGREGEGPGEFRRPSDMFITADGRVAVIQRMPGKVILLTSEGEPAGELPVPQAEDGGMQMFSGGAAAGEHVVLWVNRFARKEASFETTSSLIALDAAGREIAVYAEQRDTRDFANFVIDEKKTALGALVWSAADDGRIFTSEDFDAYSIRVWKPDGSVERVIGKEYVSRKRTDEEMALFTPVVRIRRGGRTESPEVKTSRTDRDVQQMFPRPDGSLWVLSSRGAFDAPDGAIAEVDVFDPAGRFVRQLTLKGRGDYLNDGLHVVGDRLFVVTGLRSARRSMFGAGETAEEDDADAEPMGVICYDLGSALRAVR